MKKSGYFKYHRDYNKLLQCLDTNFEFCDFQRRFWPLGLWLWIIWLLLRGGKWVTSGTSDRYAVSLDLGILKTKSKAFTVCQVAQPTSKQFMHCGRMCCLLGEAAAGSLRCCKEAAYLSAEVYGNNIYVKNRKQCFKVIKFTGTNAIQCYSIELSVVAAADQHGELTIKTCQGTV